MGYYPRLGYFFQNRNLPNRLLHILLLNNNTLYINYKVTGGYIKVRFGLG